MLRTPRSNRHASRAPCRRCRKRGPLRLPCASQPPRTLAAGTTKLLTISRSRSSSCACSTSRKTWIAAPVAVSFQNQSVSWRLDGFVAPAPAASRPYAFRSSAAKRRISGAEKLSRGLGGANEQDTAEGSVSQRHCPRTPLSSAVQVRSGLSPGGKRIRTPGPGQSQAPAHSTAAASIWAFLFSSCSACHSTEPGAQFVLGGSGLRCSLSACICRRIHS